MKPAQGTAHSQSAHCSHAMDTAEKYPMSAKQMSLVMTDWDHSTLRHGCSGNCNRIRKFVLSLRTFCSTNECLQHWQVWHRNMSAQIRSAQHLHTASELPRNARHVSGAFLAGGHSRVLQGAGGVAIVWGGQILQEQKEASEPVTLQLK